MTQNFSIGTKIPEIRRKWLRTKNFKKWKNHKKISHNFSHVFKCDVIITSHACTAKNFQYILVLISMQNFPYASIQDCVSMFFYAYHPIMTKRVLTHKPKNFTVTWWPLAFPSLFFILLPSLLSLFVLGNKIAIERKENKLLSLIDLQDERVKVNRLRMNTILEIQYSSNSMLNLLVYYYLTFI